MKWSEKPVYVCCGPTDMRKSINGLMTLVKRAFLLTRFQKRCLYFVTGTETG